MEPATPKATKSSLSVFLRLSDFCKLNGSLPINPKPVNSKDKKPEKIHLSSSEEETVLLKLLDSISSLKLSYVQLQQAYLQYDPKKIKNSDEFLISQFDSLSKLEILYNEKEREKPRSLKIKEHEKLLVVLHSIIDDKKSETEQLRVEFEELERENTDLKEKVKNKKNNPLSERRLNFANRELTPNLFGEVYEFASRSVHDFAKPLISLMRVSGWNLDSVIYSMYKNVKFHEKSHKKYVFEAYISKVMFANCRNEHFSMDQFDQIMGFEDPFETLILDPHSNFGIFCREKYLELVPSKMEDSFFGNLDHREFVTRGGHPRTQFYVSFVKMAKWIWALRVMKRTFIPKGEMFFVKEGDLRDKRYMESVVNELESENGERFRVGFTVLPGFKIGESVVRSRVYLSESFEEFDC